VEEHDFGPSVLMHVDYEFVPERERCEERSAGVVGAESHRCQHQREQERDQGNRRE
jgi:hypothetical protein